MLSKQILAKSRDYLQGTGLWIAMMVFMSAGFVVAQAQNLPSKEELKKQLNSDQSWTQIVKKNQNLTLDHLLDEGFKLRDVYVAFNINAVYTYLNNEAKKQALGQAGRKAMSEKGDEAINGDGDVTQTLKNFASLFLGKVDLVSFDGAMKTANLEFLAVDRLKAEMKVREPELYTGIRQALGADRQELIETLENRLDDLDGDLTVQVSWNWENKKLGRTLGKYHEDILGNFVGGIRIPQGGLTSFLSDMKSKYPEISNWNKPISELGISEVDQGELLRRIHDQVAADVRIAHHYRDLLEKNHFDELVALTANQPQLYFSTFYNAKDTLVGPDAYGFSVNYEWGFCNLNSFSGSGKKFRDYFYDYKRTIRRNHRLAGRGEWRRTRGYEFKHEDAMLVLGEPSSNAWKGQLAYGFNLLSRDGLEERGRIEFAGSRDFDGDRTTDQTRTILELSYTRKVRNGIAVPFTLVWVNRREVLDGISDDQFSARLGIRFKKDK